MTKRPTLLRSLRDVGINGAAADLPEPAERLRAATALHGEQQRANQQLSGIRTRPERLVGSLT